MVGATRHAEVSRVLGPSAHPIMQQVSQRASFLQLTKIGLQIQSWKRCQTSPDVYVEVPVGWACLPSFLSRA